MIKKKYCGQCGSVMEIKENMGDEVMGISNTDGEYYTYGKDIFDRNSGKRRLIYTCPKWKIIRGGIFKGPSRFNEHDRYRE